MHLIAKWLHKKRMLEESVSNINITKRTRSSAFPFRHLLCASTDHSGFLKPWLRLLHHSSHSVPR
eukprot:5251815-Amphidinium_carterae.1